MKIPLEAPVSASEQPLGATADSSCETESRWVLTQEEAANVAAMTKNPPKPNKKSLEAANLAARHVVIRA